MNAIDAIERTLSELLGLRPRLGAGAHLQRELRKVCEEHGFEPDDVALRLPRSPWLVRRLAGALTVEETFFLRHPGHFEALAAYLGELLPHTKEPMVVWSAGCASGEEPYSMAMAIHRTLGPEALQRTKLVATDIDEAALARARRGVYGPWSFRGTSPSLRSTYFTSHALTNESRLRAPILGAVEFRHLSLDQQLAEFGPASLDAVFFRNVAIYLTEAALARVYSGLARVIKKGGLLVLGPSDPLPNCPELARARIGDVIVHRRSTTSSPRADLVRPAASPLDPNAARSTLRVSNTTALPASPAARRGCEAALPAVASSASLCAERKATEVQARKLADRGLTHEALSILEERMLQLGASHELLGLRGRIHLEAGSVARGVLDLHAALALNPGHVMLRFHYALGLEALHRRGPCTLELRHLLKTLEGRSEAEVLMDGEETITVKSLRKAASEVLRRVE